MVTKKQSKNCYSEKNKLCFLLQTMFGCFSQAYNYKNLAIMNSVPNQKKKKYKTGAVQTRTSTKIRDTIRWHGGVSILCLDASFLSIKSRLSYIQK